MREVSIAVVDCALGNLQSIRNAFARVGVEAVVTSDPGRIDAADTVVLPGVGAFGDGMQALRQHALVNVLRGVAESGRPLIGICLGMQLLFSESEEFGHHEGLGIVPGRVRRFSPLLPSKEGLFGVDQKVPQVGWNRIALPLHAKAHDFWSGTPLEGIDPDTYMYFMHSFFTEPEDPSVSLSTTRYAGVEFCSALRAGSVVAFQFHPERSGEQGLSIYRNLVRLAQRMRSSSDLA